ncbi:MAG TPA: hypothetical protein VIF57_27165 [Polyangia bacterium]|jgi:hypothetical protein
MKRLGSLGVLVAAGAIGCGTTENLPMPKPATITFQLHNDGISTVYLFENCQIDFTITSLVGAPYPIAREGACACECGQQCPVCGPCFAGPREVAIGAMETEYWNAVRVTTETTSTGSCERRGSLPFGRYRIDVPVYPSAADATVGTSGYTASQTFTVSTVDAVVDVPIGASP